MSEELSMHWGKNLTFWIQVYEKAKEVNWKQLYMPSTGN